MWRSEKKNSPRAVSHLLLHRHAIQSQLGHLTTDTLEHGKKITSLSLQKVRHHVRQLSVTQWASVLAAHYKEDHMTDGISSQTADTSSFISFHFQLMFLHMYPLLPDLISLPLSLLCSGGIGSGEEEPSETAPFWVGGVSCPCGTKSERGWRHRKEKMRSSPVSK